MIGMFEAPELEWFIREDGKTWQFTVSSKSGMFAMILSDTIKGQINYFPETNSGEEMTEYLVSTTDLEQAQSACMHKLKSYLTRQSKQRMRKSKKLKELIEDNKEFRSRRANHRDK